MCKVLTLMYHRVNDLEHDKNQLAVSPDNFYQQISFLKANYPIVRFEQDWNDLDHDAVCITFDDGYMDNFTNALPILEELDVPATIFVTTGNINTIEEFWWDELERILLFRGQSYHKSFSLEDNFFSCQWPTEDFYERNELYDTLVWLMLGKVGIATIQNWMGQLRNWSHIGKVGREKNIVLQTDRIEGSFPLFTIGAHTVNHPFLENMSEQEQNYEVGESIKKLELLFRRKIEVFSYPFGAYDKTTIDICKKWNIYKAATTNSGVWESSCDAYQIPRNAVRNWSIEEFVNKMKEFWDLE